MSLPSYFAEDRDGKVAAAEATQDFSSQDMGTLQGDAYDVKALLSVARENFSSIARLIEEVTGDLRENQKGEAHLRLDALVRGHRALLGSLEPAADWIASYLDSNCWQLPKAPLTLEAS